jgi:uncharacterized damage-inducible protein DinB
VVTESVLRAHLQRVLDWEDAHVGFDAAVAGIPPESRGLRPAAVPHSPWDLVEHIRIAQRDILDFCTSARYRELEWPRDYWPAEPDGPTGEEWEQSLAAYRADREALRRLAAEADLADSVPAGTGQTYLRELLLVADHTAYHVGQLVLVRRLLGLGPGA